jgi:PPOX class probable F420-dependent enzyme
MNTALHQAEKWVGTMSVAIPEKFFDLFSRSILCAFTTLNADGSPHSVPVWCDFDGAQVHPNLRAGTKKARNVQRNSAVCLLVIDPDNPWHWIEIQGRVGDLRDENHGAREHINALPQKYTGQPRLSVYRPKQRPADVSH